MKKIIILLACFVLSCNSKSKDNTEQEIAASTIETKGINVNTTIITPQTFQKQIIANGITEALQKTEIRFKTSERIASIKVKNGQKVIKGQTLAVLDNTILSNQLNKAKIDVDNAKSKLQEEKINYGVGKTPEADIPIEVLKNLKIKSGFNEAINGLENAQLLYNQTIIKAPFNGVVANIEVKTGNFITSSDVFCTIVNQQKMEVVFSVLENELAFIKNRQQVIINPFTDLSIVYNGSISEINPLVDENGLIQVKATINDTSNSKLFDGMNVKITANQEINDLVVVPKEALVLRSNKEVVFTVENGLAKWNYVEKFDENSTTYALKKGVKVGDTIIISGNMNLSHDAKVNVNTLEPGNEE